MILILLIIVILSYSELISSNNILNQSNTSGFKYSTDNGVTFVYGLPNSLSAGNIVISILESAFKTSLIYGISYVLGISIMNDNLYSNVSDINDTYCCHTSDFVWSDDIIYSTRSVPHLSLSVNARNSVVLKP